MRFLVLSCIFATTFLSSFTNGSQQVYDVHWLSGPTIIDREMRSLQNKIDIYCYSGSLKTILALWQTVKFNIKIKSDDFNQYLGGSPTEVLNQYNENGYGWAVDSFLRTPSKSVALDLFNSTCMTVTTKERHSIELQVIRIDIWRVLLMALGILTIFLSKVLSGNPIFYYICGILVGVCASFMVFIYYMSKFLPKKTLTYGILIGGWTVGVYLFQQAWENIRNIMYNYQTHVFWYTVIVGFISFLVCYRIGPPKDKRSQNLVMWTLQLVGVAMIFFSSDYREASAAIIVMSLCIKYFLRTLTYSIRSYWRRKFPPRPNALTSEEYYEEGARETKSALDNLRKYCSSPDCAQWKIMLKLNDSKRLVQINLCQDSLMSTEFASFVEGNSHLSDDEVLDYESYAFSLDRSRKCSSIVNQNMHNLETTDDDSSESEDEI